MSIAGLPGRIAGSKCWGDDFDHLAAMENNDVFIRPRIHDALRATLAVGLHFANGALRKMRLMSAVAFVFSRRSANNQLQDTTPRSGGNIFGADPGPFSMLISNSPEQDSRIG